MSGPEPTAAVELHLEEGQKATEPKTTTLRGRSLPKGEGMARRTTSLALIQRASEAAAQGVQLQQDSAKVREATAKLKTSPDDVASCTVVGRHLCLTKDDWDQGLALLAKGSDPALKSLAQRDLEQVQTPHALAELAGDWWACSEKQLPNGSRPHSEAGCGDVPRGPCRESVGC